MGRGDVVHAVVHMASELDWFDLEPLAALRSSGWPLPHVRTMADVAEQAVWFFITEKRLTRQPV